MNTTKSTKVMLKIIDVTLYVFLFAMAFLTVSALSSLSIFAGIAAGILWIIVFARSLGAVKVEVIDKHGIEN